MVEIDQKIDICQPFLIKSTPFETFMIEFELFSNVLIKIGFVMINFRCKIVIKKSIQMLADVYVIRVGFHP